MKQFCRRIFNDHGLSIFDQFSSEFSAPSMLLFMLILLILLVVASSAVGYLSRENIVCTTKGFCHSERNNLFGDLFSTSVFLMIICLLNIHSFKLGSFCLMNPLERMCDPYREALSCAHTHKLNAQTGMGHYFDGYAGFFRRKRDEESTESSSLNCFLDIGRDSWFQFMSLDFGENRRWTESSFVLTDGEFAPFQPNMSFKSLSQINFGWLLEQNISLSLGARTSSTGIFVFAADSEVRLYYHSAEMTG